ncbi:MAG: molybdate ABC transporter permease subunit [Anaerolineae bacterium]|nr:molybdate ABC transporter permease subunit [Anaerolineae bacterium]
MVSAAALFLLVIPIIVLVTRGLSATETDADVPAAIALSVTTTLLTALVTIALGTPLAYVFARWRFPLKSLLNVLIELPIVLPPVVAGLALLITFGRRGLLGPTLQLAGIELPFSTAAVIIAQTFVSAPFYIRSAQIGFHNIPLEIEDAGRVDGAGGFTLFRHVTLPLALPSMAAGLTLSWARALGEFGATILFAGSSPGRTQTMPLLVYRIFEGNIDGAIWTSLILLAMALIALLISQWLTRRADS